MYSIVIRWALCVCVFAAVPVVATAQSEEKQAVAEMESMVTEVNQFVGDVRFDEADIESLIELWDEFDEVGQAYDDDEDEIFDYSEILADAEYRRWASSHGLDADEWMRKTVRITMVLYREMVLESAATMPHQMQQQMKMIEGQREQFGEEAYQQMKEAMEASTLYMNAVVESAKDLPQATPAEAKALEAYRDELTTLMSEDEDYEDEWGDEDDSYDEEEDW